MTQDDNGEFILAYNPSKTDRIPLNLTLSNDGISWTDYATLESDPVTTYQCQLLFEVNRFAIE